MDGEKSTTVTDGSVSPTQKTRKKTEFSKCILFVAGILNVIVIVFSCVMIWKTNDLTPLCYLIPSTAAEVGTGTAFYYNKAKMENKIKLMAIYGVEPKPGNFESSGSDSVPVVSMYDAQG